MRNDEPSFRDGLEILGSLRTGVGNMCNSMRGFTVKDRQEMGSYLIIQ